MRNVGEGPIILLDFHEAALRRFPAEKPEFSLKSNHHKLILFAEDHPDSVLLKMVRPE